MVKLFVIDFHPVVRRGLASMFPEGDPEFKVVGEASGVLEAVDKIEELQPDIVIMDMFTPGGDSGDAVNLLQQKCPKVKVIVLTDSNKKEDFFKAIRTGATGYLLKSLELNELVDSVRLVSRGSAIVYSSMAVKLLDETEETGNGHKNGGSLSDREVEILKLVALGSSNKEIASHCYLSETTVKAHLRRISEKLVVKNRAQAVARAIEGGYLVKV